MLSEYKNKRNESATLRCGHPENGRKGSALKRAPLLVSCVALASFLSGCKLLLITSAVAIGAVGLAGYGVYKAGDAVVTGVGNVGKATASVMFFNGDYKTQCDFNVETVWKAANLACQKAGFGEIDGSYDALSGKLTAKTRDGAEITIKLKSIDPQTTEIEIRVGVTGDLEMSETIHGLILQRLPAPVAPKTTTEVTS
ncbi:DUF3568 family protein [Pontiella sulfatireligans]|uniref:DUF3568 family protein n=1 Tax=Pontiella sulfatireligans TaxID=2750658 RepID=A0A6C2UQW9_9BACT|nr:DUF3568 family protein [Pontiella sulfatireligans]VGO22489.1 hypothetical protein SCARR_04572 [Pontiella sulfatireligans]